MLCAVHAVGAQAELSPRDWLLLLFVGASKPLDRVRIQKALFLFAERSQAPASEKYVFEPYYYGPISFAIYPDLDSLVGQGLLRAEPQGIRRSPDYSVTPSGVARARELRQRVPPERLALIGQLRQWVTERPFRQLLTDIYRLYPAYATRSVFR